MPKVKKERDAASAAHPYKKPQFKFGSPKKAAGKVGQAAATPGTTTKSANGGGPPMRAPSLQAANPFTSTSATITLRCGPRR